ncbi:MAG: hypothetical protein RLZZ127_412 [Planctomycetota bacterium]|jgi:hypothetical protein
MLMPMDADRRDRLEELLRRRGDLLRPAPGRGASSTDATIPERPASAGITLDDSSGSRSGVGGSGGDQLPAGLVVGGYRIEGLLGRGGMGQVYRAHQLSMNRPVAFKVLSPRLATDPSFRERFLREARAAGRLHHPNLISVHDAGEAGDLMFFSMELVEGESLRGRLRRGALPEDEVWAVARQVLAALRYAHDAGVIHRDIKPDNLMLSRDGVVKVADLGLSRLEDADPDAGTTVAGAMMGTPHYMAPEQGRDARTAGAAADLYGLGATLYHLATGRVPFTGATPMAVVIAHSSEPLVFPEERPGPALRRFIAALMAKDPAARPAGAAAALDLLMECQLPSAAPGPRPHHPRRRRRGGWLRPLVTAALTLVLVAAGWHLAARTIAQRTADQAVADARERAALGQWQAAVERLRQARLALGEDDPLGRQLDLAATSFSDGWDSWAATRAAEALAGIDRALAERRLADAMALVRTFPESCLSPAVRPELEQRQERLEQLAKQADQPAEWAKSLRTRAVESWWRRFTFPPGAEPAVQDQLRVFSGRGRATADNPFLARPRWPLRLTATVEGPGSIEIVAGARALRADRSGFAVIQADGSRRDLDSRSVILRRRDGIMTVQLDHRGEAIELGPVADRMELAWRLDGGRAAVAVGVPEAVDAPSGGAIAPR